MREGARRGDKWREEVRSGDRRQEGAIKGEK